MTAAGKFACMQLHVKSLPLLLACHICNALHTRHVTLLFSSLPDVRASARAPAKVALELPRSKSQPPLAEHATCNQACRARGRMAREALSTNSSVTVCLLAAAVPKMNAPLPALTSKFIMDASLTGKSLRSLHDQHPTRSRSFKATNLPGAGHCWLAKICCL